MPFCFQRRHDVGADDGNGGIETVFQAGEPSFWDVADENVFEHDALVRGEAAPVLAFLQQVKNVVLVMEDEAFVVGLFDFEKTAHGKIDDGRCNVARMNAILEQSSGLGRGNAGWGLIHGRYGNAGVGIAAGEPPQTEHDDECDERKKNRGVASDEPEEFCEAAGLVENAFWDVNVDGHPSAHGEGICGFELGVGSVNCCGCVVSSGAVDAGEGLSA